MKCPVCGKKTLILETRHDDDTNTVYRRRTCTSGHRSTTLESVAAVGAKRAPKRSLVAVQQSKPASAGVPAQKAQARRNQ